MDRIEFYKHDLGDAEVASVAETLRTLFLTLGPRVREFERAFGAHLGCEHVVGVSSCTMGLAMSLEALGIARGDEVITTPMTFISTPNAALFHDAVPVFADVDPKTGLIDPNAVEAAITPRTRAVIAVHLYGQLADMRTLRAICDKHGLALIEDAAHATEAERDGVRVAHLGDATVFSFYATKTMTSGDGGAIVVRSTALYERLQRLRNHGVSKDAASRHAGRYAHWDMLEFGYKGAMTDIEAAILLPQIERLHRRRDLRQSRVERYERALASRSDVQLISWSGRSSHHLFTVLVPLGRRDQVLDGLGERGIGAAVNYRAVHTLKYYRERFGYPREAFPVAADIGDRTISLPLYAGLTDPEVDRVVTALGDTLFGAAMTQDLWHSVVIPLYNEEANVRELTDRLVVVLEQAQKSFEVVFVDDGSRDQTAGMVRALSHTDPRIKLIRFSRNYGQEAAVQAGILRASGRWIIQMDGDLQNPPEELTKLLEKRDEGFEIVYGVRRKRRDPLHRVVASRFMMWVMRRLLGIELPEDVTTFRVIEGSTARLIAGLPEKKKFFSALAVWTGARSASVPVGHAPRIHGVTKYSLGKLINHTFDLMVGFSTRPLRLIGTLGGVVALFGLGFGLFRITQKLLGADITMGYTSLFSAVVILGGLQLIALSVIGEYIGRIFIQIQGRPLYNVAEEVGFADAAAAPSSGRLRSHGTDRLVSGRSGAPPADG